MFFIRDRVDEDLERIRKANLETPEHEDSGDQTSQKSKDVISDDLKVGPKDIFAMIIAVFSLILPVLVVIIVVTGLFLLWFLR